MKPSSILLNKPQGMTPLAAIDLFRSRNPEYADITLGVAGRLDPMANGLLLVLVGDENKKRSTYENLSKTYEVDVLFGITTDTYDLLGLVTRTDTPTTLTRDIVSKTIESLPSTLIQEYPPYSSKPVLGKPLFYWAREGKLDSITIPKKQIELAQKILIGWQNISTDTLTKEIEERIAKVSGDFRQVEILKTWRDTLPKQQATSWPLATLRITCSSGTYMRSIAQKIGEICKTGALAFAITRIAIGNYTIENAQSIV